MAEEKKTPKASTEGTAPAKKAAAKQSAPAKATTAKAPAKAAAPKTAAAKAPAIMQRSLNGFAVIRIQAASFQNSGPFGNRSAVSDARMRAKPRSS